MIPEKTKRFEINIEGVHTVPEITGPEQSTSRHLLVKLLDL